MTDEDTMLALPALDTTPSLTLHADTAQALAEYLSGLFEDGKAISAMSDVNVTVKVPGLEKRTAYTGSGLGAVVGPMLAPWIAC